MVVSYCDVQLKGRLAGVILKCHDHRIKKLYFPVLLSLKFKKHIIKTEQKTFVQLEVLYEDKLSTG